jgi:hypothetical protein
MLQFAYRLAGLLGCTVADLPELVTWDEWIGWQAWYDLQPWGEERQDQRTAVAIAYQLAPYLPKETELPSLQYPYSQDDAIDPEQLKAAAETEARRWAEWDAERRRKRGGRS